MELFWEQQQKMQTKMTNDPFLLKILFLIFRFRG